MEGTWPGERPDKMRCDTRILLSEDPGRLRILVVDGYADAADSLALLLQLWGHDVDVCRSSPEALGVARVHRPDVVVTDVALPKINGYQLAERLREEIGPNLVLIALTGLGGDDYRVRSREAGFVLHLLKPVEPEKLREILSSIVELKRKET
jgi:CheY-like chemotaxis protein